MNQAETHGLMFAMIERADRAALAAARNDAQAPQSSAALHRTLPRDDDGDVPALASGRTVTIAPVAP